MAEDVPPRSRARILVVDDDPLVRRVLERFLGTEGHQGISVETGAEALAAVDASIDVMLLDFNLPDIDGQEVTRRIRARPELAELPIIMITGDQDRAVRLSALEAGVTEFLTKPFDLAELRLRTQTLLQLKRSQDQLRRQRQTLEVMVAQRSAALNHALQEMERQRDQLREAHLETLERLALAAEYKDEDTASHIRRVGRLCALLAARYGCTAREVELIELASPLHDVGKLGVPDSILMKPGRLDDEERRVMQHHAEIGARILAGSRSEILRASETIARTHHEWWNGAGYPNGLAGEGIPLFGRIAAVADVFDALTSERPYKKPFSNEKALGIMKEGRDRQFDPRILDILLESMTDVDAIQLASREEEARRRAGEPPPGAPAAQRSVVSGSVTFTPLPTSSY